MKLSTFNSLYWLSFSICSNCKKITTRIVVIVNTNIRSCVTQIKFYPFGKKKYLYKYYRKEIRTTYIEFHTVERKYIEIPKRILDRIVEIVTRHKRSTSQF